MTVQDFKTGLPYIFRHRPLSQYLLDELENHYFYLAKVPELNDPFDCHPGLIEFINDEKDLSSLLVKGNDDLDKLYNQPHEVMEEILTDLVSISPDITDVMRKTHFEIFEQTGIVCFTEELFNTLCWSHYSSFHKGIALIFNTKKDPVFQYLKKVKYLSKYEPIKFDLINMEEYGKAIDYLLTTKSTVWKQEKEWRLINPNLSKYYFSPSCLEGIVFGLNTPQEIKLRCFNLTPNVYPQLSFYQTKPIRGEFGIEIVEVDNTVTTDEIIYSKLALDKIYMAITEDYYQVFVFSNNQEVFAVGIHKEIGENIKLLSPQLAKDLVEEGNGAKTTYRFIKNKITFTIKVKDSRQEIDYYGTCYDDKLIFELTYRYQGFQGRLIYHLYE